MTSNNTIAMIDSIKQLFQLMPFLRGDSGFGSRSTSSAILGLSEDGPHRRILSTPLVGKSDRHSMNYGRLSPDTLGPDRVGIFRGM